MFVLLVHEVAKNLQVENWQQTSLSDRTTDYDQPTDERSTNQTTPNQIILLFLMFLLDIMELILPRFTCHRCLISLSFMVFVVNSEHISRVSLRHRLGEQ